eukprot:scaffold78639_cov30-Tisochrysis_lutea.AAC.4
MAWPQPVGHGCQSFASVKNVVTMLFSYRERSSAERRRSIVASGTGEYCAALGTDEAAPSARG